MDRTKLMNAIIEKYHQLNGIAQEALVMEALRRISGDANLIAFAIELGIDTDELFTKGA